jgi:DNA-binding response OmpR family regulator
VEGAVTLPVLIVDDSLTVRMDLREAFHAAGLEVAMCSTAAEANRAFAERPFGVIVLDVLLPDGDGIALLADARQSRLNANTPVLLLSSEAEVRDRVFGLTRGADDYVGKPYDATHVVARSKELLATRGEETRKRERSILVIDDSATYREQLGAALKSAGYRVVTADTGEKGLLAAASLRPDAVIVDRKLPGIDGQTVVRRMKLDGNLRRTPILVLTGSDRSEDEVNALEAGADAFVRKTDEAAGILARLTAMLRPGPEARAAPEFARSSLGPKRILAVDDSPTLLHKLSAALHDEGYDLVTAHSGEEALELLEMQRVDCVLLDLLMPGLSGEETCRRIRSSHATREVPVIVLTSLEERVALARAIDAGADDCVTKSDAFDALRARIRAQLRRRQVEEENRDVRERLARHDREAAEARASQELASVRGALLADLERKNLELSEADRRKNEFLGILSHELRNPLAPIKNALWLLVHADPASAQAQRARAIIDRQVTHLSRLVDDLLDVTRVSRGKIRLVKARCDLSELLARVAQDHEPVLADRGIKFENLTGRDPVLVYADATRVAQILGNPLQNSAKFTNVGGRVTVALRLEGGTAVLTVSDTGIGIAPELLGRVFEAFTQADESLDRSSGGLGLGLALVKGLVELHGGTVEARSEGLGRGSEFIVRLPVGTGAVATDVPVEVAAFKSRRVLVIDDNNDAADSLREVLELVGHEVEVAHDGHQALEKARAFKPDVALCDIGLPGMDGYEVARAIRADPTLAATALVAFTGYARPDDERRAAEAGFDGHLAKPAPLEQVERAIATQPRRARA